METPLPSRRITRSQASIMAKQSNQDKEKPALIDITNGSPIVGLAIGSLKTPSSRCSKKRMIAKNNTMTPGSGESLLRGQVKTLLQKVEEESGVSKNGFDFYLWCHNTPKVCNFLTGSNTFTQMLNEVICEPNQEKSEKVEKKVITRSLFSDVFEKSHDSDSSECNSRLTCQDLDASKWSVQVNASTSDVDELCEGMSKISVYNGGKFTGRHIRFVYNSDGELEGELSSSSKTRDSESEEQRGV
ncbi:uncharacterized protein LOC143630061 [Bidens hawaiensis]|uniref:uncharacterized protein LOC143630061 n=1 Tax=Bidens hawaiensis TaxID=980011 RepID=UPI00404B0F68